MRNDMHKVIVEEPRWGHGLRNHTVRKDRCRRRMLDADALDALPQRGAVAPRDGLTKSFGEHLGPLRRFLMSRVGEPWDAVYSEIRQHLSASSTVQMHILQHLFQYVSLRVVVEGRQIYSAEPESSFSGRRLPLWDDGRTFYVDPASGCLCRPKLQTAPWRRPVTDAGPERIGLGAGRFHVRLDGAWFLVTTARVTPAMANDGKHWDFVLRAPVGPGNTQERRRLFGSEGVFGSEDRYAVSKRQLSRREVLAAGLSTELAPAPSGGDAPRTGRGHRDGGGRS